jgi:hypothetical protein
VIKKGIISWAARIINYAPRILSESNMFFFEKISTLKNRALTAPSR